MKIKNKTCYSCLISGIGYILFVILLFVAASESDDWKVEFAPYLGVLSAFFIVPLFFNWYKESISKTHILKVKNGYLIFDNKDYKIDKLKFKLKEISGLVLVKLYLGNEKLEFLLDYEELERFLYIIKPYLKNPQITENINFKEIKLFKEGFFIKHKKFFYDKIKAIEIYKRKEYPLTFLQLKIVYKDKMIEKKAFYNEENLQKILFIILKIKKFSSFKYLKII